MRRSTSLLAAACGLALIAGATSAAQIPVFSENFEGMPSSTVANWVDTANLHATNASNIRIANNTNGNTTNYYDRLSGGSNMDLLIIGSHGADDLNLTFDWRAGQDIYNADFRLPGVSVEGVAKDLDLNVSSAGHLILVNGGGPGASIDEGAIPGVTANNTWTTMHVLRVGSSLSVNAWPAGNAEPAGWLLQTTIPADVANSLTDTVQWRWQSIRLDNINSAPIPDVPEPASLSLLGLGALAMLRRRRA